MLARLDQELAPLRSSVDREGVFLRIDGSTVVEDLDKRVVSIVDPMGFIAERITDEPDVPRWFGSESVDELSLEEATVLAQRWMKELGDDAVIADPARLDRVLREALLKAFRDAARAGQMDVLEIDETMLRTVLAEDEARAVRRWLSARL